MTAGRPTAPPPKAKGEIDHLVEAASSTNMLPRKTLLLEQLLQNLIAGADIHAALVAGDLRGTVNRQINRLAALGFLPGA